MMKVEDLNKSQLTGAINVAQLLKDPTGSSRNYDVNTIIEKQPEGSIEGEITLIHTGQGILVRSKLSVQVELVCGRCLKRFPYSINFAIEEELRPTIDISSGLPLHLSEESEGFTIDKNHVLDLGELIRQYILLNLPMKPLCRPDCAGIKEMKVYGST
ncbi:MAG: metal-binding protein [Chloroflexi bacterium CG_4_10_14_0_8_um_filter_46_9]|nr:MAG: metal-binding protein [Chloroflexi bacterium CG15_BIG_FIL_POST_REV_8_21_14_020_46_15]PIZ27170.1 MAG: metal-binding protein [Chloroflexi bacterium CG_4_10_14_0_8_um_filter_46_9]